MTNPTIAQFHDAARAVILAPTGNTKAARAAREQANAALFDLMVSTLPAADAERIMGEARAKAFHLGLDASDITSAHAAIRLFGTSLLRQFLKAAI